MIGNYPVNDDWVFIRQIEAFDQGILRLNAEIDPSFIAQGFLGFIWSRFFGSGFISLQILTVLITLLGLWGFLLILKMFKVPKKLLVFGGLLYVFNPLIFTSAFSFMTDNYFLTFTVLAIYFLLKFQKNGDFNDLLWGSVPALLAAWTRQVGIFIGVAFLLGYWFDEKKRPSPPAFLTLIGSVILGFLVPHLWPDYGSNRMFNDLEGLFPRLKLWFLSWHYLPLFIFPLLLGLKTSVKKRTDQLIFVILSLIFAVFLYNYDIFPVGNVLYLEELHAKSDFRSNFSLLDNIFFKLWLTVMISFALAKLTLFLKEKISQKKLEWEQGDVFLVLLGLMNCGVLLISSDFYDRYLLPSFVCFFIIFLKKFEGEIRISKRVILTTALMFFISVALQWEFSAKNRLKWQQVRRLMEETGYVRQIELNDTYIDYIVTQQQDDFTGLIERKGAHDKVCYVQDYTLDSDSEFLERIQRLEERIDNKILEKKKPYGVNKKSIPRAKNNLEKMMYEQKYFSFLFDTVGKETYVGSWCLVE